MTLTTDYIGLGHQLISDYRAIAAHLDDTGRPGPGAALALPDRASLQAIGPAPTALDLLDGLLADLVELFGPPVGGTPYALTFASSERHDGEEPYTWVVNATSLDEARRILASLPDFQGWYEDQLGDDEEPDVVFVTSPRYTHAGIPSSGYYTDLRREQARIAAEREHHGGQPDPVDPSLVRRLLELPAD